MSSSPYLSHYERSHALVIGINAYEALPALQSAVHDAEDVAQTLAEKFGFEITLLRNAEATRDAILAQVSDSFSKTHPDDRVLIYFAGHGMTRRTASGDRVGLLVPYGVEPGQYHQAIEMEDLVDQSKFMPAKHILFILDACFSGLAMPRAGEMGGRLLKDLMTRRAVQAIAAGQEDQMVADLYGPGGHSIFTGLLLERLDQQGSLLTGNELGLYLQRQVGMHTKSRQTPHFGHLLGSQGGDFVFWAEETAENCPLPSLSGYASAHLTSFAPKSSGARLLKNWWRAGLTLLALILSLIFGALINNDWPLHSTVFAVQVLLLGAVALDYAMRRDWLRAGLFGVGVVSWLVISLFDPIKLYHYGPMTDLGILFAAQCVNGALLLWSIVEGADRARAG